jgi:hypothetical protein
MVDLTWLAYEEKADLTEVETYEETLIGIVDFA